MFAPYDLRVEVLLHGVGTEQVRSCYVWNILWMEEKYVNNMSVYALFPCLYVMFKFCSVLLREFFLKFFPCFSVGRGGLSGRQDKKGGPERNRKET